MERIDFLNIKRLRWCMDDAGIPIDTLAQEAGIPEKALRGALEEGKGLTFNQVRKLATYFGRGVFFFLQEGEAPSDTVHSPQFRTLTAQKPELSMSLRRLIERVERQRDHYLYLVEELGIETTGFSPPALAGSMRDKAEIIRQWLNLEDCADFESYRHAIEAKGILVFRSNGYQGKWQIPKNSPILGFSIDHEITPCIVVKKLRMEERQTFTLFHELSHLLLHGESMIDDVNDLASEEGKEKEANELAGRILVPDDFLSQIDLSEQPDEAAYISDWLQPYKKKWGVSVEVILRRLAETERVTRDAYQNYRRWLDQQHISDEVGGSRKYRYREPLHIFGEKFVKTVLDAVHSENLTISRASDYLDGLKIKDVHELERYVTSH